MVFEELRTFAALVDSEYGEKNVTIFATSTKLLKHLAKKFDVVTIVNGEEVVAEDKSGLVARLLKYINNHPEAVIKWTI